MVVLAAAVQLLADDAVRLRTFFGAATHPLNLAVFRIVLFAYLLLFFDLSHGLSLSRLGLGGRDFAIEPTVVEVAIRLFQLCCLAGLLGLWARPAAIAAAVLGLYVLGIGQFFGKVNHYHHLWWFTTLLACSPCGAALSVDAVAPRLVRCRPAGPGAGLRPAAASGLAVDRRGLLFPRILEIPGFGS